MSVLKRIFQHFQWQSRKSLMNSCPSGCQRLYSKDSSGSKESPLKMLLDEAVTHEDAKPLDPDNVWASTPYPVRLRENMEKEAERFETKEMSVILFPGQGTHYVGMGQNLIKFSKAKRLFDIASEILKVDLLKINDQKDLYKFSQEMIVVCSLAAIERLREERPTALQTCVATAGFSLGEITALIFAGSIPLEQGIRLVSLRNAAMQAASQIRPGGMMTILYSPHANIPELCRKAVEHSHAEGDQNAFCTVANYLYPSCKVLAGSPLALDYVRENAAELGIKATKRVKVRGAFHSVGVEAAVIPFEEALALCDVEDPKVRILSSMTGKEYKDARHIRRQLPKQIVNPVKWEQLIHNLYARPQDSQFPRTFEVGPGKTLRAILRKVNAKAWDYSISIEA